MNKKIFIERGITMWDRKELKRRAKEVLRTSYWKAFLVSIILVFFSGGGGAPSFNFNGGSSDFSGADMDWGSFAPFLAIAIVFMIFVFLFALAFRIFLGFPLEVGSMRYFKQSAEHEVEPEPFGLCF